MRLEEPTTNAPAGAEPEALFEEARRHRRTRRLRLSLLVIAGAAAGGGFYGAFGGGSPHTPTVPQIEAGVAARLAHSSGLVLHESRYLTTPGSHSELWIDLKTGNERSDDYSRNGRRAVSFATSIVPDTRQRTVADVTATFVAYHSHSAFQNTRRAPLALSRRLAGTNGNPFASNLTFHAVGRDTIDGQATIHLRAEYPQNLPALPRAKLRAPRTMDVWITAGGYRLVREEITSPSSHQTILFHWLPRTRETLAKVELTIPSGYTHQISAKLITLPARPSKQPTAPVQSGSDQGVSITVGANGVVVFDTKHASAVVRRTFDGNNTSYACLRTKAGGRLTRIVSGQRRGVFAPSVGFQLSTRTPFDGCELSTGYGRRWPDKFGGHDPVEIVFTPTGSRYFEDRAAARELSLFVRSRKMHLIRHQPPGTIAAALAAHKHGVTRLTRSTDALSPGEIGYTVTSDGVILTDRSTTGRAFTVEIRHGRIAHQNVKPLGYVF